MRRRNPHWPGHARSGLARTEIVRIMAAQASSRRAPGACRRRDRKTAAVWPICRPECSATPATGRYRRKLRLVVENQGCLGDNRTNFPHRLPIGARDHLRVSSERAHPDAVAPGGPVRQGRPFHRRRRRARSIMSRW